MNALYLIPARGGSKGIPHKNIKPLNGKPLIEYSIDIARHFTDDANICVSTDDVNIRSVAENYGLKVPFLRPDYLATDNMGTYDVIMHALNFYEEQGNQYDVVVLLQPTSPFRTAKDVQSCIDKYASSCEMVVTVKEATSNPYYDCFELDGNGFLIQSKGDGKIVRRQDAPKVYEYTGSVYVMNVNSLKSKHMSEFNKIVISEVDEIHSVDLDTPLDWKLAELMIQEKMIEL